MSGPIVGALLSGKRMLRRVGTLLRGRGELYAFPSWGDLNAFIETGQVDAVFIDPQVESAANWKDRLLHLEGLRRHQVILYTDLTPEVAAILLELGQTGVRAVVFSRLNDCDDHLLEALASAGVTYTPAS